MTATSHVRTRLLLLLAASFLCICVAADDVVTGKHTCMHMALKRASGLLQHLEAGPICLTAAAQEVATPAPLDSMACCP